MWEARHGARAFCVWEGRSANNAPYVYTFRLTKNCTPKNIFFTYAQRPAVWRRFELHWKGPVQPCSEKRGHLTRQRTMGQLFDLSHCSLNNIYRGDPNSGLPNHLLRLLSSNL